MPVLFTKKGAALLFNANKLPFCSPYPLNRREFSGETYHFVDKDPVELANLILTIKSYLEVKTPREIYVPYPLASMAKKTMEVILKACPRLA